ncbi:MAG: hypothetical protein DMD66_13215 [Gemmatimonadetes bacterium]|nr:MAG: hypothetical protein DMD66_13215 [Gemmatimonadota bacterium]
MDPEWANIGVANVAWSPDGSKIAFAGVNGPLDVVDADGTNRISVADICKVWPPDPISWSPDGKKIAYCAPSPDVYQDIYVSNANGSGQTRITRGCCGDANSAPSWSSDGTRIAYQHNSGATGRHDILVINADGTGDVNLTETLPGGLYPVWSPVGARLAFWSISNGAPNEIYVMNADGSQPTRLTNNPAEEYYPAWSPSGSTIAFASNRDGNYEIYVMSPDGSGLKRVTNNPAWDADPAWASDQVLAIASAQARFAPAKVRDGFSFARAGEGVFAPGAGIDDLQQLTIDAWVKHNSLPPGRVQRYVSLGNEKAVLRYDGAAGFAQLHFYMRINGELQHIRVDNVLREGVFHHVAGSYDGSVMRLYLDGVEVGNRAITGSVAPGDGLFFSSGGLFFSSGDETLDGLLDEIDIFNRALDPAEVRAIFEAGSAGKCKNAQRSTF